MSQLRLIVVVWQLVASRSMLLPMPVSLRNLWLAPLQNKVLILGRILPHLKSIYLMVYPDEVYPLVSRLRPHSIAWAHVDNYPALVRNVVHLASDNLWILIIHCVFLILILILERKN